MGEGFEVFESYGLGAWLEQNGAYLEPIGGARRVEGEIRAELTIRKGQLICHIPRALMLPLDVARQAPIAKRVAQAGGVLSDIGTIAACLVDAAAEPGFLQPYADSILGTQIVHPLLFDEAVLPSLRGSTARNLLDAHRKAMLADYRVLDAHWAKQPPSPFAPTIAEFARAYAAVLLRANPHTFGAGSTFTLTPLVDSLPCSAQPNAYFAAEGRGGALLIALEDIAIGTPIRLGLGALSNAELFARYGVLPERNPDDAVALALPPVPRAHPLRSLLEKAMAGNADPTIFTLRAAPRAAELRRLLSYFRMLCLEDSPGLLRVMTLNSQQGEQGNADSATARFAEPCDVPFVSRANEIAALRELARACTATLKRYEAKQKIVQEIEPGPRKFLQSQARRVCQGETAILCQSIGALAQALSRLKQPAPSQSSPNSGAKGLFVHLSPAEAIT